MTTENLTINQMIAEETAARLTWEAETTTESGYTIAQLRAAFDRIAHPVNWKERMVGIVPLKDFGLFNAAAIHFAGSSLTILHAEPESFGPDRNCVVEGAGYYACIGA